MEGCFPWTELVFCFLCFVRLRLASHSRSSSLLHLTAVERQTLQLPARWNSCQNLFIFRPVEASYIPYLFYSPDEIHPVGIPSIKLEGRFEK